MSLGIGSILTIIFVLLKAFGKVDWSWIICFLPFIISGAIQIAIILLIIWANRD